MQVYVCKFIFKCMFVNVIKKEYLWKIIYTRVCMWENEYGIMCIRLCIQAYVFKSIYTGVCMKEYVCNCL